ncbi:Lrp/AsnC ligand binding domain-containing protein [Lipingzhangella sp. LS1_29]|uniref:Lrp/AsnC ligand binding domain-containing protein n=1 Tax=Lipingzhangella rawalii TaxID=2055835 RepID=A0ABU2H053_9ACTN|nr:Lrp/AsnC ligand binding domain-containing protein [Lipingzhangella rawalii]MDS1268694.1 Lrp/AsnC ligand binding domain-containing protein [Lipingzhangella rawalii]
MITAIVMIKADVNRIPETAQEIAGIDGVSEVYSVTGNTDLIAIVRVRQHDELAEVIPQRVNQVPGVLASDTHIAFHTYSRHDLQSAFSLGMED